MRPTHRKVWRTLVEPYRTQIKPYVSPANSDYGRFIIPRGEEMFCVIVCGSTTELPWDHVSVSMKAKRCPTWEEMCWIKDLFFDDDETVVQYHPAKSDYVNNHPYCLHLWRPTKDALPTPPKIMV